MACSFDEFELSPALGHRPSASHPSLWMRPLLMACTMVSPAGQQVQPGKRTNEKAANASVKSRSFRPSTGQHQDAHPPPGRRKGPAAGHTPDGRTASPCCCSTLGCPRSQHSAGKPGPRRRAHRPGSSSRRAPGVAPARTRCCSTWSQALEAKQSAWVRAGMSHGCSTHHKSGTGRGSGSRGK